MNPELFPEYSDINKYWEFVDNHDEKKEEKRYTYIALAREGKYGEAWCFGPAHKSGIASTKWDGPVQLEKWGIVGIYRREYFKGAKWTMSEERQKKHENIIPAPTAYATDYTPMTSFLLQEMEKKHKEDKRFEDEMELITKKFPNPHMDTNGLPRFTDWYWKKPVKPNPFLRSINPCNICGEDIYERGIYRCSLCSIRIHTDCAEKNKLICSDCNNKQKNQ